MQSFLNVKGATDYPGGSEPKKGPKPSLKLGANFVISV
jgi:hypothetical protein